MRKPFSNLAAAVLAIGLAGTTTGWSQEAKKNLPLVWVLSTGGTIAGAGASSTNLAEYKGGTILGEQLVKAVPEIQQYANVKVEQIVNIASPNITLGNLLTLANGINKIFAEDPNVAGVVVTHGTNTLEETAYFLNLTIKHDRPVIVVGSMRPSTAISADGPLNLLNGVRTAISPDARGKGVLVVMNDEINSARDVTKTNTYRVETFRSPELGYLGYVDEDKVSFYRASTKRHTVKSEFDVSGLRELPKVDIVYSYIEPKRDGGPGAARERRQGHRVRRHRRRRAVEFREGCGQGDPGRKARAGALQPHRQRPRHRTQGIRRARLHPRRHAQSAKGAHPLDAGADAHQRHQRNPAHVRGVLSAVLCRVAALSNPLIPAEAGTQCHRHKRMLSGPWVPASAGTSGMVGSFTKNSAGRHPLQA
jgi:L-asparaginase type II